MFPEWSTPLGFLIGAAMGSFLNVVIYRLPRGMSLVRPPSHCPNCSHPLGLFDLFPLVSFLVSGARCRYCRAPVSWRYFVVEALTGTVWAAFWWQNLVSAQDPARFVALAALGSILIACIFIDLYTYILPDSLNAWLLLVGLGYNVWLIAIRSSRAWVWVGDVAVPSAVAGALTGAGVFWGIALLGRLLFRKDAMGHGDIKLARGIGSVLFQGLALLAFGLSVAIGAVLGAAQVLLRPRQEGCEPEGDETQGQQPEPLGSLVKCGLGYLLCVDVVGLLLPRLERRWFGEEPQEAEDDWKPSFTTIPFGPYLALGAILTAVFSRPLTNLAQAYWTWAMRGP